MPKQQQHARIAGRVAGSRGRTEASISGKRKLDVKKGNIATEVERSSDPKRIGRAIARLQTQGNARKELRVPQNDLSKAVEIAKKRGAKLTIKNLKGSQSRRVR